MWYISVISGMDLIDHEVFVISFFDIFCLSQYSLLYLRIAASSTLLINVTTMIWFASIWKHGRKMGIFMHMYILFSSNLRNYGVIVHYVLCADNFCDVIRYLVHFDIFHRKIWNLYVKYCGDQIWCHPYICRLMMPKMLKMLKIQYQQIRFDTKSMRQIYYHCKSPYLVSQ